MTKKPIQLLGDGDFLLPPVDESGVIDLINVSDKPIKVTFHSRERIAAIKIGDKTYYNPTDD